MTSTLLLQLFLLLNVFLIGILTTVAAQHAHAHFKPRPEEVKKPRVAPQHVNLPPEVRKQLLQESQEQFESVLDHSAAELQQDMAVIAEQLNKRLEKLGVKIVDDELQRYQDDIEKLRARAEAAVGGAQTEIAQHQAELKAKLAEEIAAEKALFIQQISDEKQQVIQQIDTKLADAVASFLTETLQHNVDLGAQTSYLIAQLDEHKEDFKRGVKDEA